MKMRRKSLIENLSALSCMLLLLCGSCKAQNKKESVLQIDNGDVTFEINNQLHTKLTVKLGNVKPVMEDFQPSEQLVIGRILLDSFTFENFSEEKLKGDISGKKWIVSGKYDSNNLQISKTLEVVVYDGFPNLISTKVTYTNTSNDDVFVDQWTNNSYKITSQGDNPPFWAFQGSSSSSRSDWIVPLQPGYYKKNFMGMNDTDYGGGIPVTSIWRTDVNIAVGHLALTPKQVSLPTEIPKKENSVGIGVSKNFEERTWFNAGESLETLETFVSVSKGDYYTNLSMYSNLMQAKGIEIVETEEASFEPIWCAWGYERQFTLDEIVNTLPKVKELGIKWAVLDDGFQIAEGDWDAHPDKFPKGNIEIKNLVDKIHDYGLKAKIWWTPLAADPHSTILKEYPEMRVFKDDESPQFITWWDAYYLSPTKQETIKHTKNTIDLFMNEWGFDGLKMDGQHMNAVGPDHSLDSPEEAVEGIPDFFQMIYDKARSIKPNAVVENCPCGTCMSYYNMASMNQAVSSDPLSSWQIRHKGKTYKALVPNTAYYGDHVELSDNASDFASSFGIGAVLGTKFTWPKDNPEASDSFLLTPQKEKVWKKWFNLYNEKMLSKEPYLGNLYDIGYDKPETHVIKKGKVLYYGFYADKWDGPIELRGLSEGQNYTVENYFDGVDMGEVSVSDSSINAKFRKFLLVQVSPK